MIALLSLIWAVACAAPQGTGQGQFQRSQPGQSFDLSCQDRYGIQVVEIVRQQGDIVVGIQCQPIVYQDQLQQVEQPNCRQTEEIQLQNGVTFERSCNEQEYLAGVQSQVVGQGQRSIRMTCCRVANVEIRQEERYISQPIDVIQPQGQPQQNQQSEGQNQIRPEVGGSGHQEEQMPRQIITRLQINSVVAVVQYGFLRMQGQQYATVQTPQNRPLFDDEIEQLPQLQDGQFSEQNNQFRRQCPRGEAIANVEVRSATQQGGQTIESRYQCQPVPGQQQEEGQISRRTTHFQTPNGEELLSTNGQVQRRQYMCVQGEYVCGIVRTFNAQQGQVRFAQQCCSNGQIRVGRRETVQTNAGQQSTDLVNLLQRLRGERNVRLVNVAFNGPQKVSAQYGQLEVGQPRVDGDRDMTSNNNVLSNIDELIQNVFGQPSQINRPTQQTPFPFNNMNEPITQNIVEVSRFMCQPGYGLTTWELAQGGDEFPTESAQQEQGRRQGYRFQCQPVAPEQQQQVSQTEQCRYTQPRAVFNGMSFGEMDSNCMPQEYVAGLSQLSQNGRPMIQLRCCHTSQVSRLGESCYNTEPQNMMPASTRQLPQTQTGRIHGIRQVGVGYAQELIQAIQFNPNMEVVVRYCVFSTNGQTVQLDDVTTQVPPPQGVIGQLQQVQPGEMTPVGRGFQVRCQSGEAVAALKVQLNNRPQQGQDIQMQVTCATPTSYVGRVFRRYTRLMNQNGEPLTRNNQCTSNEYVCGIVADYQGGARGFGLECCSASGIMRDQTSERQTETVQLTEKAQPLISEDFGNGVILQQLTIESMNEMTGTFQRFRIRNQPTGQGQCRVQEVFDQTKQLTSQAFFHFQAPDVASCVTICRQHPFCLSAGYQPSTGGSRDTEAVCILSYGQGQCPQFNNYDNQRASNDGVMMTNGQQDQLPTDFEFGTGGRLPEGRDGQVPTITTDSQVGQGFYPEYLKPVDQVSNSQPVWLTCIRC